MESPKGGEMECGIAEGRYYGWDCQNAGGLLNGIARRAATWSVVSRRGGLVRDIAGGSWTTWGYGGGGGLVRDIVRASWILGISRREGALEDGLVDRGRTDGERRDEA